MGHLVAWCQLGKEWIPDIYFGITEEENAQLSCSVRVVVKLQVL